MFDICILLAEAGYKYSTATLNLLNIKYCKPASTMISVEQSETDGTECSMLIVKHSEVVYKFSIARDFLVSNLVV
jgi:hypothetical protein